MLNIESTKFMEFRYEKMNFSKDKIVCKIYCKAAFSISKKLKFNPNEMFENTSLRFSQNS